MKRTHRRYWVIATIVVLYSVIPLLWLLRISVTPETLIHKWPPTILPSAVTFGHFTDILSQGRFWWQFLNSLFVCSVSTIIALALGAAGAYGFARYRFRFRDAFLVLCLGIHLVPGMVNMTSIYRAAELLSALNSLIFVAMLKAGGVTFALLILLAAFRNVPRRLEQAALLDGLSQGQAMLKVTLPMAGPGIFTAGLLLFIQSWNSFFLPFLILEQPEKMTLTVGLYRYFSEHGFEKGHQAAFMLLSVVPVLALFFLFRKRLWRNIEI